MQQFFNVYGLIITIVSGILGLVVFFESRRRKIFEKTGSVLGAVSLAVCLMALTAYAITSAQALRSIGAGANQQLNSTTPQSETTITPIQVTPTSPTPIPTATPSPTPASPLPCIVNVGTWTNGSADWKVLNGILLNSGTNDNISNGPSIIAPCQLGATNNYAVETNIQVTQVGRDPCFGITVRGNSTSGGWQGYKVGIGSCACCNTFSGGIFLGIPDYPVNTPNPLATFDPGVNVHSYRVEVKDNTIKFFIDGALTFNITDNSYLTGSEIGLWCSYVQLQVTSFKVTAL